jgi:hypothetical protein
MLLLTALLACSEYDVAFKEDPPVDAGDDTAAPQPTEDCNGVDDDGDGVVDEGFDVDFDGVPDCADQEDCDGVDNDADGVVDEGFDADADGLADCYEMEACDGLDNDGDAQIDEGFDADADGLADCFDVEECDGLDNDGDVEIDEGFDVDGDGILDCDERTYVVELLLTADDAWEGWVDGTSIGGEGSWNTAERVSLTLDSGPHVVAVHAMDTGAAIAGFLAAVSVDGAVVSLSGDGAWRMAEAVPSDPSWTLASFDDSAWTAGTECSASDVSRYWNTTPSEITSLGARWIWPRGCTALDEAALRLRIDLP